LIRELLTLDADAAGAWHILFDSLWKNFANRFNGILERVARCRELVDKEAISIEIVESRIWRAKLNEDLEQRERIIQAAQLQDAINWLAVEDRHQDDHLDRLSARRQPDTGEWIFKTTEVKSWISDDTNDPMLWLKGIPGAGAAYLKILSLALLMDNRKERTLRSYHTLTERQKPNSDVLLL
jgi:hypothetical protein